MGSKFAAEEDPELTSSKTHRVYSSYEAVPTDGAHGPTGHLCTATLYGDRTDNGAQTARRTARETGSGNRSSEGRCQGTAGTAIRPGAQDNSNKDSKDPARDPCPHARGGRPGQRHGTPCRSAFIAHLGMGSERCGQPALACRRSQPTPFSGVTARWRPRRRPRPALAAAPATAPR